MVPSGDSGMDMKMLLYLTWRTSKDLLSSRSLLLFPVKYSSVSMSIPNSLTIPSPLSNHNKSKKK